MILKAIVVAAAIGICASQGATAIPESNSRRCITDPAGWYRDPPEKIRSRFERYKELGVDTLRVEIDWRSCEPMEGQWSAEYIHPYLTLAKEFGFRLKIIVGVLMAPPRLFLDAHSEARILDQNGQWSTNTISYWYPGLHTLVEEKSKRLFEYLKEFGILDRIDYVIPSLGPAGEPLYPVPWTLGPKATRQTYWCYDGYALRDFSATMRRRYGDLAMANSAWSTDFKTWDEVTVLPPGTQPGPYWNDVLKWYRDSKRNFVRWQIGSLRRQAPKSANVVVYIPGTAYTEADWDDAVKTAKGNDAIMMMADSRFLIDTAHEMKCWLQYTGCENGDEVARLRRYADTIDPSIVIWGENAGDPGAASDPGHLADVVIANRLWGLDYTHAHFAFERDGITPNATMPKLKEAYERIREHYK